MAGRLAAAEGPDGDAGEDRRVGVPLARPLQEPQQVGVEAAPGPGLLPSRSRRWGPSRGSPVPAGRPPGGPPWPARTGSPGRRPGDRPPRGPTVGSGGRWWATASKNSSDLWAPAMLVVSAVAGAPEPGHKPDAGGLSWSDRPLPARRGARAGEPGILVSAYGIAACNWHVSPRAGTAPRALPDTPKVSGQPRQSPPLRSVRFVQN